MEAPHNLLRVTVKGESKRVFRLTIEFPRFLAEFAFKKTIFQLFRPLKISPDKGRIHTRGDFLKLF